MQQNDDLLIELQLMFFRQLIYINLQNHFINKFIDEVKAQIKLEDIHVKFDKQKQIIKSDIISYMIQQIRKKQEQSQDNLEQNYREGLDKFIEQLNDIINQVENKKYQLSQINIKKNNKIEAQIAKQIKNDKSGQENNQSLNCQYIGRISSVFRQKFGTPRQSDLVKKSRGKLTINADISSDTLIGLQEYSHIWIIFQFHNQQNTKNLNKIKPPKFNGAKIGIFGSRTPHRINPIGLSLARLIKIEGKVLYLEGIDLIQDTPVLDIKPYHFQDIQSQAVFPSNIVNHIQQDQFKLQVQIQEDLHQKIKQMFLDKLIEFYDNEVDFTEFIIEFISLNPLSIRDNKKFNERQFAVYVDNVNIFFQVDNSQQKALITDIKFHQFYSKSK